MARGDHLEPPLGDRPVRIEPMTFPSPLLIPEVRHWFEDSLDPHVPSDALYVATLLLSELATNAVQHAATPFTVSAALDAETLRVEVQDHSERIPEVREPEPDDAVGRGMLLVDRLAARWGAEPSGAGKRVWFELDLAGGWPAL